MKSLDQTLLFFARRHVVGLCALGATLALTVVEVSAQDAAINALRGRLVTTAVFAKQAMENALSGRRPTGKRTVDFEALLGAVDRAATNVPTHWTRKSQDGGDEVAEGDGRSLVVNRLTAAVRMRDERGYDAASKSRAADAALVASARSVVSALGAGADETKYQVNSLMRQDREDDQVAQAQEVARKVIVTREIAGIPVESDRVVLSYSTDGSLRKVLGHWHQINFDASALSTSLSDSAVSDRALQRIQDEAAKTKLGVASDGDVRVRTVFVPVEVSPGEFKLVAQGRVEVPTVGPGGTPQTVLDFDM